MTLPASNISLTAVRNEIFISSDNLTEIVGDAATGGDSGNAFNAAGYLYDGARPYWNIYAYHIPAEWVIDEDVLKLKKKGYPGAWEHKLGDFREYKHDTSTPHTTVLNSDADDYTLTLDIFTNLYEWHLPDEVTHILIKSTVDTDVQTALIPIEDINWEAEEVGTTSFTVTGIDLAVTTGMVQIYASDGLASELADITEFMTGSSPKVYNFDHVGGTGTLYRTVSKMPPVGLTLNARITTPSGSGNIDIDAETTSITGITITVTATSESYSGYSFDLYLAQTGESNLFISSELGIASAGGHDDVYNLDPITLSDAVTNGDELTFKMLNIE